MEEDYNGHDPDANPLINKDGNAFTDGLIDHWETVAKQHSVQKQYTVEIPISDIESLLSLLDRQLHNGGRYLVIDPDKELLIGSQLRFFQDRWTAESHPGVRLPIVAVAEFLKDVLNELVIIPEPDSAIIDLLKLQKADIDREGKNIKSILFQLKELDFAEEQLVNIRRQMQLEEPGFVAQTVRLSGDDTVLLRAALTQGRDLNYSIQGYEVQLQRPLPIEDIELNGLRSRDLEERMNKIDWSQQVTNPVYRYLEIPGDSIAADRFPIEKLISDVYRFAGSADSMEREVGERLQFKYWNVEEFRSMVPNLDELRIRYEPAIYIELEKYPELGWRDAVELLKGTAIEKDDRVFRLAEGVILEEFIVNDLAARMKAITWVPDIMDDLRYYETGEGGERINEQWGAIAQVTQALERRAESGPDGQKAVADLISAHWPDEAMSVLYDPLNIRVTSPGPPEVIEQIKVQLDLHQIELSSYQPAINNSLDALAQGYYVREFRMESIIPEEHIDQFVVIAHRSPPGMIYEIGHELKTLHTTTDYTDALRVFQEANDQNMNNRLSHYVIGQFKGETLSVNFEGYPEHQTGVVLHAGYSVDHRESVSMPGREENRLQEPMEITTPVIIRLDPETHVLKFYDEHLDLLAHPSLASRHQARLLNLIEDLGFGQVVHGVIQAMMLDKPPVMDLSHIERRGTDLLTAEPHVEKSSVSDLYFLRHYDLTVEKGNKQGSITHRFPVELAGYKISINEGYNLLSGRAVYKEIARADGVSYHSWIKMDMKSVDMKGMHLLKAHPALNGMQLTDILVALGIRDIQQPSVKELLLESLRQGNLEPVLIGETRVMLEANPVFNSVNVFSKDGQRLDAVQIEQLKAGEGLTKELNKATTTDLRPDRGQGMSR